MFGSLSQETAIFQNLAQACCAWHRQVNIFGSWILDPVTSIADMVWGVVNLLTEGNLNFAAGLQI